MFNKKAQVWVETVIYTLIGLSIIAIIFATAMPQIEKAQDRAVIEQTISALNVLDNKISEVEQAPGNSRIINFKISKGKLEINAEKDSIKYILEDTKLELSEPDEEVKQGRIVLKTEKMPTRFKITLTMDYDLDLINKNGESIKILQAGATPYKIVIENIDVLEDSQNTTIEFSII